MKPNRLATGLLSALLAGSAAADVLVNFRNNVLGANAKVVFGHGSGFSVGSPVVNANGRVFVAQLFTSSAGSLTPVGSPASFLAVDQSNSRAGTWAGGNRIITGLPADATVSLVVRVWDASFASHDAAYLGGGAVGESAVFTYRNALSNPEIMTDTYMLNFRGFSVAPIDPEPSTFALALVGFASLMLLHRKPAKKKAGSPPEA